MEKRQSWRWSWGLLLLMGTGCGAGTPPYEVLQFTLSPSSLYRRGGTVQVQARILVNIGGEQPVEARLVRGNQTVAATPLSPQDGLWVGSLQAPENTTGQDILYEVRLYVGGVLMGSQPLTVLATSAAPVVRSLLVQPPALTFVGGTVTVRAVVEDPSGSGIQRVEARLTGPGLPTPLVAPLSPVGEGVYERLQFPIPPRLEGATFTLEVVATSADGLTASASTSVQVNPPSSNDQPPPPPG